MLNKTDSLEDLPLTPPEIRLILVFLGSPAVANVMKRAGGGVAACHRTLFDQLRLRLKALGGAPSHRAVA